MVVTVRAARLPRLLGAVVVCAVGLGAWVLPTAASDAASTTHTVEVQNRSGGSLHPASLEIHVGDTVAWEWMANEWHTIAVAGHGRSGCNPLDPADAPCEGHVVEVTFEEAGEYRVRDEVIGTTGTVTVTTPPPPKPTPSATPSSPSPSSSPPPEPTPSETTEPADPDPTSEPPSPPPSPEPTEPPPPAPAPPAPTTGTADAPAVDTATAPDAAPTVGDPSVADSSPSPIPEPTFDDFPEAVDPSPVDDVEGEVALGSPDDDGGQARLLWGMVGGVTVLGTLGAFGRTVLFSEPWDA